MKQLEKSRDLLQNKFDAMEEIFWNRSDKWQESEKGQEFDDNMNGIDTAICELNSTIDDLEVQFNLN